MPLKSLKSSGELFQAALGRYAYATKLRSTERKCLRVTKSLSDMVENAVYGFYGRTCVICSGTISVEIHHINEIHKDDSFPNVIPVCSTANQAMARDDYRSQPDLADQVEPSYIRAQAREHFRLGRYPQAYACNSLAAYLFESRSNDCTKAVESLVFCFAALRPLGHPELLLDTLAHCIHLFRTARLGISKFWKAEVLSQVGLVLYDFRAAKEALECELHALEMYDCGVRSDHPEGREARRARGLKRLALVHGPFLETTDKRRAFAAVKEAKGIGQLTHDHQAIASALWVEATLEAYVGRRTRALDLAKKSLLLDSIRSKADKWTVVALQIEAARQYQRLGDRKSAIGMYAKAKALCETHRIVPIPVPVNGSLIALDPGLELLSLGEKGALIGTRAHNPFTRSVMDELYTSI